MKTLCVTGHRPNSLPFDKTKNGIIKKQIFLNDLNEHLVFCINQGYTDFISGGALGVDTLFALEVLKLKQSNRQIRLELAIPCIGQDLYWNDEDKKIYEQIKEEADTVTVLSPVYTPYCMQKRNEYMVDKSDCVLCCYTGKKDGGTYNTITYAQKKNKKMLLIDLSPQPKNGGNKIIYYRDKIIY